MDMDLNLENFVVKLKSVRFPFSISVKVILPYLILTLAVAVTGAYVVTKLVANSLHERLTNQLLEAGRVVSDSMVRQEIKHLEIARIIVYTQGLGQALTRHDAEQVNAFVQPVAVSMGIENIIIVDAQGKEILHILQQTESAPQRLQEDTGAGGLPMIQEYLGATELDLPPKRALAKHPVNQLFYYYTFVPIYQEQQIAGVVVVGTALKTLLPDFKNTALADITFYIQGGQAILTSLSSPGGDSELLSALSLTPEAFTEIISNPNTVTGKSITVYGRLYNLAWGPLRVGNEKIGVFAVALPLNFVLQAGTTSRNTYAFLFSLAMVGVIFTGFSIARLITRPINTLLETSQAIAGGDLNQRTGIRSEDEIGLLAETFDDMTDRLASRTRELEKAYQTLEQMDHTKDTFINVTAHELRTPLTLVKGYTQMLLQKSSEDASLVALSEGILSGTNRMLDIVTSLLDVSRIDSNMLKVVPAQVSLDLIVDQVKQEFQIALTERNLTFEKIGVENLPPIHADPDLLYKTFYHLIMNAIKYTPDGGTINVIGRSFELFENPEVEIVIRDTGIGIDPQHHDLIFEKFFQTGEVLFHSSGKTKFKGGGPGLGLAIARGIVQAHGGKIWVESPKYDEEELPGSKFFIRLPIQGMAV